MNKKALSPLMATILLVVFALVVGTVTMNVGKEYVEKTDTEETATEERPTGSSIVIDINDVLGDDLKELQIMYITGKITKEEYLEMEKELIG
jgi:flagellin-like protein